MSAIDNLKIEFSDRARQIVFWTGAGLSSPAMPSWISLRDQLFSEVKVANSRLDGAAQRKKNAELAAIAKIQDIWVQFDRVHDLLGRDSYIRKIKDVFSGSETMPIPRAHEIIWALDPSGVITLNIDLFTQRASAGMPGGAIPIQIQATKFSEHFNVLKEKRPFVAYPHGHIDEPNSWTFTKKDLDRRLTDTSYIEWLKIIFRVCTVVFVGVTASDVAIGGPIEKIVAKNIPLTGHYWITSRGDLEASEWAERSGVNIIHYSVNNGSHAELLHVLSSLKGVVKNEDYEKERPVYLRNLNDEFKEAISPKDLQRLSDEEKRIYLNSEAKRILQNRDLNAKNSEYAAFLAKYQRAIHDSWYVSSDPEDNEFVGYRIISKVDEGAFGNVYKAISENGSTVAVKILKNDNFSRADFYKGFRRGANSLRIVTDRGIEGVINYIDAAEIPPTIIMNWCDGQSLSTLVPANFVREWNEIVEVFSQLAIVLRKCHLLPERVLHRDLRPANIMIEGCFDSLDEWRVVVLDFDLSCYRDSDDHSIMHSPAFGYLAPEQRSSSVFSRRNSAVDSYGFGMTLYYVCGGKDPFPDQHATPSWIESVKKAVSSRKNVLWKSLPKRISRLIVSATLDDQSSRIMMSQIEGELESLKIAMMASGPVPLVDVVLEELVCRVKYINDYYWDSSKSSASYNSPSGVYVIFSRVEGTRFVKISMGWVSNGMQDWVNIESALGKKNQKISDLLGNGCFNVSFRKDRREFCFSAEICADDLFDSLDTVAGNVSDAVSHISSIIS